MSLRVFQEMLRNSTKYCLKLIKKSIFKLSDDLTGYTVELQWLEHRWLVCHCYFQLVLGSLIKNPIVADTIVLLITSGDFMFYIYNGLLCVLVRIASMGRF